MPARSRVLAGPCDSDRGLRRRAPNRDRERLLPNRSMRAAMRTGRPRHGTPSIERHRLGFAISVTSRIPTKAASECQPVGQVAYRSKSEEPVPPRLRSESRRPVGDTAPRVRARSPSAFREPTLRRSTTRGRQRGGRDIALTADAADTRSPRPHRSARLGDRRCRLDRAADREATTASSVGTCSTLRPPISRSFDEPTRSQRRRRAARPLTAMPVLR